MDWESWLGGSAILGVAGAGAVWLRNRLEWKWLYDAGRLALFVVAIGAGIAIADMVLGR